MSTPTTTPTTPAIPTVTAADIAAVQERIYPYLEEALKFGIAPRPITGLMLRLGDQFGVDINAVGETSMDTSGLEPLAEVDFDPYYDQLMMAVWVLCEKQETLVEIEAEGGKAPGKAFSRWRLEYLTCLEAEAAAMRAFVGRWIEHRLEMAAVYGNKGATAADA